MNATQKMGRQAALTFVQNATFGSAVRPCSQPPLLLTPPALSMLQPGANDFRIGAWKSITNSCLVASVPWGAQGQQVFNVLGLGGALQTKLLCRSRECRAWAVLQGVQEEAPAEGNSWLKSHVSICCYQKSPEPGSLPSSNPRAAADTRQCVSTTASRAGLAKIAKDLAAR